MSARFDFHIHSLLTEGELVPSEIVQRCSVLGYGGIAITDHVDQTNLEHVLGCLAPACRELGGLFEMEVLPGVELTHVHPDSIEALVERARKLGAEVVVVHGETLVEPVRAGTNSAAVNATGVDILAHPGLITVEEARLAKENNVFLELSSRKGHCLANGHVAKVAKEMSAKKGLACTVLSKKELAKEKMNAMLMVGEGSMNEPKLVVLQYIGNKSKIGRAHV